MSLSSLSLSPSLVLGTLLFSKRGIFGATLKGGREGVRVVWVSKSGPGQGRVSCLLARNKSLRSARDLRPFASLLQSSLVSSATFDAPKSCVVLEHHNKKEPHFILYLRPRPISRETWCGTGVEFLPSCSVRACPFGEKPFPLPIDLHYSFTISLEPSLPRWTDGRTDGWNGTTANNRCAMHAFMALVL